MKIKPLIFLAAVLTAACMITAACGDGTGVLVSAGEDWSWESGAVNIIEGSLSLSEYSGRELTIQVTTDLPYGSEEEEQAGRPVRDEKAERHHAMYAFRGESRNGVFRKVYAA